jgi:RimJ/RimL family protein N-acetyltransferase
MYHTLSLPMHTPRLTLRDFRVSDFDSVCAYAADPEVIRFMFYGPRAAADTHDYLQRMLQSQTETPRRTWEVAVVRTTDGQRIGAGDLTLKDVLAADLGYILARVAWGQGYATEIARLLLRAGFTQLGLQRIFAICDIHYLASARVLEKAGLRRETTLYRHKQAKGRWWDVYRYAITYPAWLSSQGQGRH